LSASSSSQASYLTSPVTESKRCCAFEALQTVFFPLLQQTVITNSPTSSPGPSRPSIIGLGFCDMQNNQGRGYQSKPKAEADNRDSEDNNHK